MIETEDVQLAVRDRLLDLVGLPDQWAWDGKLFKPATGVSFIQEQFESGIIYQAGVGPGGAMLGRPILRLYPHAPLNSGLQVRRVADLLLAGFPPGYVIPLAGADTLQVRSAPNAPSAGPIGRSLEYDGFVTMLVTIPFVLETFNSI